MNHDHEGDGKPSTGGKYVLIGFALIAGYFLITEHQAHVFSALPYLLLLACPLLHLFHGRGGHGGHGGDRKNTNKDQTS
ncbi:MAG: hypothetical protein A2W21_02005 [Betaproteobacteria bacterium RBG_16_66_20]|nr:MAG: hypothetical protein A2W21_02005 [Betaproteobacteria bacterium RBG_16_66_20]